MSRRYQIVGGGGSAFASGGITNNVVPKSNGAGALQDSSITDNGSTVSTAEPYVTTVAASLTVANFQMDATNKGLFNGSANTVGFGLNNTTTWLQLNNSGQAGIATGSNQILGWTSATTFGGAVADTALRRRSAANIQLGLATDVNGSPVAQTISVQNAITGSNLAGANFTLDGGLGTGTGTGGQIVFRGADSSVATGTTAQTNITRLALNATKSLTSGAATTLVSIPLATLQMAGGHIDIYMEATDGTNQATRSETIYYAAENSAGVFVVNTSVVGTGATACTVTKTLTATYAITSANPALLQVTPTLTGITATRFTCVYAVCHLGNTLPTI